MSAPPVKAALGSPIEDASEETFISFAHQFPSTNLGFIDSKSTTLEVEVDGHDYIIQQSPTLLNSDRDAGTTGAVLWKVTPLLASWLASFPPVLSDILHKDAVVVELGCGVAGLLGMVMSKSVQCYVLTDQNYVMKNLRQNLEANATVATNNKKSRRTANKVEKHHMGNLELMPLDWENDSVDNIRTVLRPGQDIDLVVLCDGVYNEHLVPSLVETCVDLCMLRTSQGGQTVVLVAQQLRSEVVFELFLETMMKHFDVFRIPDDELSAELRSGSGYAVHAATPKKSEFVWQHR